MFYRSRVVIIGVSSVLTRYVSFGSSQHYGTDGMGESNETQALMHLILEKILSLSSLILSSEII